MVLTGRKVFIITASAFGVIIGVNVLMATLAVGTFPGLEVKNSYVASQQFDESRASQESLGWTVDAGVHEGVLTVAFSGNAGDPVEVTSLEATVGRATQIRDDFEPEWTYSDGAFTAPVDLAPGKWDIRFVAMAPDGTPFRQRLVLHVD